MAGFFKSAEPKRRFFDKANQVQDLQSDVAKLKSLFSTYKESIITTSVNEADADPMLSLRTEIKSLFKSLIQRYDKHNELLAQLGVGPNEPHDFAILMDAVHPKFSQTFKVTEFAQAFEIFAKRWSEEAMPNATMAPTR